MTSFGFRLREPHREELRAAIAELRSLLTDPAEDGSPMLRRLFPSAYGPDDAQRNAEYSSMVRDELLEHRLEGLRVLEEVAGAEALDAEQLERSVMALNDLRLVLGTRLDITEDLDRRSVSPDDPKFDAYVKYDFLTMLQGEFLQALTGDETW